MTFSISSYALKCVLGMEIVYLLCMWYGPAFLTGKELELHQTLFNTIPGYDPSVQGVLLSALFVAVVAYIIGSYIGWMLNSSLVK